MPRFAPAVAAWMRHNLSWSNSRQAWQGRIGALFVLLAVAAGFFWLRGVQPVWHVLYWGGVLIAAAALLHRGWLRLFGPVLFFDLLCLARRLRYFLARVGYAAFLFLIVGWTWFTWSVRGRLESGRIDEYATFANGLFEVFVSVQFVLVALLTPVYTASAVADEKERRTLEFLLATDLRNREIVLSKLLARFLNLDMLVLAGLPILALLQFLGGVDPDLVLASYAATLATVASVACLGTLFSVLVRKGRDAILLTYLCIFAYFVSWRVQFAIPLSWRSLPSASSPVTLQNLLDCYNAGNILHVTTSIGYLGRGSGVTLSEALPGALRGYLIFHGLLALVCITWAVFRLRAVAMKETYGKSRKLRLGVRVFGRPPIGEQPMVWKEVFAEPGLRLHWLGRIVVLFLVVSSFVPVVFILKEYYDPRVGWGRSPAEFLAVGMNIWGRTVGAMVATLLLFGVAVRAAGSITGERDRQTLDSLLTSPLDSNAILYGKWLGALTSVRRGWFWLAAIYGLTFVCGGVNFVGLLAVIVAWFVYAGFAALLGLWFSASYRTTMRATVGTLLATLGAFGGHWLIWACCLPLLWTSSGTGRDLQHLWDFQAFALTPPITLGQLAFLAEELERMGSYDNPAERMVFALIGVMLFGGIAAWLRTAVSRRLRAVTLRDTRIRPECDSPPPRRLRRSKRMENDVLTVEEVRDQE
jgi:ABC-type transport system involved in multi-copper enzyme maturation permease subunit